MIQRQLIDKFNNIFRKNSNIDSVILIGSFGRNTPKANSDIDYQILVSEKFNNDFFLKNVKSSMTIELEHFLFLEHKNKWCFYLTQNYIKVEVFVCSILPELDKYFLGSEIIELKNAIIFDKTNTVKAYLMKKIKLKEKNYFEIQKDKINSLTINFQDRFESCSNAHAKSDGYKFHVLFSHAVNNTVRMAYLCEGGDAHDYMPPNFLTNYSYKLKLGIENLATMNLQTANVHKRKLLDLFKRYLRISIQKFNLSINETDIVSFLENIYERDFFWNFRDVSKFNPKIKQGLIYRSSALCLYENEANLDHHLQAKNITTIIDLRADRELKEIFYDKKQKNSYDITHAPFDPWNQSVEFKNTYNKGTNAEIAYHFFSRECKPSIKLVITSILAAKGAVDIHCHAGKDRTGIIITLLHLLSGANRTTILLDYLASEMDTKEKYIQILLDAVNQIGGIEKYLQSCNISKKQIESLKMKICQ